MVTKIRFQKKEKKIHGSWEDVSGYFSSHQWKGGGIDGRVSPRTGSSDRIVLAHCAEHVSWLLLVLGSLSGGDWSGEEKTPGHVQKGRFSGRHTFSNSPIFYVICYILSAHVCDQDIEDRGCRGPPLKFRQLDGLFQTLKTMEGLLHLFPPRTQRNSWYGVL